MVRVRVRGGNELAGSGGAERRKERAHLVRVVRRSDGLGTGPPSWGYAARAGAGLTVQLWFRVRPIGVRRACGDTLPTAHTPSARPRLPRAAATHASAWGSGLSSGAGQAERSTQLK